MRDFVNQVLFYSVIRGHHQTTTLPVKQGLDRKPEW